MYATETATALLGSDAHGALRAISFLCPACYQLIVYFERLVMVAGQKGLSEGPRERVLPRAVARPLPAAAVPATLSCDYLEACNVLEMSAKASAALSRRCLQHLLREAPKTTTRDLDDQIQEVLDSKSLPGHLAESLDSVRVLGNFAAHPIKSKSTGEIVDVEAGEAEWTLDTLDGLFDFYYVQPERTKQKNEALNKKLTDAGKPLLKS